MYSIISYAIMGYLKPFRISRIPLCSGLDSFAFGLVLCWEPASIDNAGSRSGNIILLECDLHLGDSLALSVLNSCMFQFIKTNWRFFVFLSLSAVVFFCLDHQTDARLSHFMLCVSYISEICILHTLHQKQAGYSGLVQMLELCEKALLYFPTFYVPHNHRQFSSWICISVSLS